MCLLSFYQLLLHSDMKQSTVCTSKAAFSSLSDKTVYFARQLLVYCNTGLNTNSPPSLIGATVQCHISILRENISTYLEGLQVPERSDSQPHVEHRLFPRQQSRLL